MRSIFMTFLGFVYHVEDYCCANFRNQQSFLNMLKIELENRDFRKSLYFKIVEAKKGAASWRWHYIVDAGKKEEKRDAGACQRPNIYYIYNT